MRAGVRAPDADEPADDGPAEEVPRPGAKVALRDPFTLRSEAWAPAEDAPDEEDDPDEDPDPDPNDWRVTGQHVQHAVRKALNQQAHRQLPAHYAQCVARVVDVRGQELGAKPLRALRERLAQAIGAYKLEAIHGPLPPALVEQLTPLHRLQQLVDEAWEAFRQDRQPVELPVKKKWCAQLRISLSLLDQP